MNNEQALEFIEDYRAYECLWNIHSTSYKNKRNDAHRVLVQKYGLTEKEVRIKIKSLRSYFSKENQKVTETKGGAGGTSKYELTWFAYRHMVFVASSVTPRKSKGSLSFDNPSSPNVGDGNIIEDSNDETSEDKVIFDKSSLYSNSHQPALSQLEKQVETDVGNITLPEPISSRRNFLKRKRDDDDKKQADVLNNWLLRIRMLNPRHKAIAKNRIKNILFDLQMEEMSVPSHVDGRRSSSSHENTSVESRSNISSSVLASGAVESCTLENETEINSFLIFDLDHQ